MTGREKVVSGLRHCLFDHAALDILDVTNHCNGCPYYTSPECECDLYYDALELLKVQEPLVIRKEDEDEIYDYIAECPECGVAWAMCPSEKMRFCPGCGKAVRWDG